jgi:RNA polymerase sigma factor (sigma-70 family)
VVVDTETGSDRSEVATEFELRIARIYNCEIERLSGLGAMLTGALADGQDLAQEVFVHVIRRSADNPDYLREPAWPYLRAVIVRLAMQRRRQLGRELRRLIHAYQSTSEPALPEQTIDFVAALSTLPPRMRACAALHYAQDLNRVEIAAELGCSPRTVQAQLRQARRRLASRLALGEAEA